jgi:hypothetical protein
MSKKKRKIGHPKQETKKNTWFPKVRPFLFPVLFGLGSLGAYYINVNDLMNKVGTSGNVGVEITWVVQVCTYLCVIGLIVLGYQFEAKMEDRNANKVKV